MEQQRKYKLIKASSFLQEMNRMFGDLVALFVRILTILSAYKRCLRKYSETRRSCKNFTVALFSFFLF